MRQKYRRPLLMAAGLAISALAVGYLLHGLRGHWQALGRAFLTANYLYVIPAVAFLALMYALRIVRWRLFLKPIKKVPYSAVASATLIGFMSTCVLPLRPGELIRPYVLHRKGGVDFGHAAGTAVGLERAFDLIGVCFLILLTLALLSGEAAGRRGTQARTEAAALAGTPATESPQPGADPVAQVRRKSAWLAGLTLLALAFMAAVAFFPEPALRAAQLCVAVAPARWRPGLLGLARSVAQTMGFMRNPRDVAAAMALSFAQWLCFPLSTWCVARAFGISLPLGGAMLVQVLVTLAVAAPQAPGFVGPFQVAAVEGMRLCGAGPWDGAAQATALAFAMMMWAVHVFPITGVGLAVLRLEGLNLLRLAEASRRAASDKNAAADGRPS